MAKTFALLQYQKPLVEKLCYGKCGDILVGTLIDSLLGEMYPCKTEVCKYEEKRIELGECMEGVVWVRKLREQTADEVLKDFLACAAPGRGSGEFFYPDLWEIENGDEL